MNVKYIVKFFLIGIIAVLLINIYRASLGIKDQNIEILKKEKKVHELKQEITDIQKDIDQFDEKIVIEEQARRLFGLIKDGEYKVIIK